MSAEKSKPKPRSELLQNIGRNIRRERLAKKIKQKDLADYIGSNYATITKYETGKINISMDKLSKIAECLDVPVETLVKQEK